MSTIYRVRLVTADDALARKYGEHFYEKYECAARKAEALLREMTQHCAFVKRGATVVHEETDNRFSDYSPDTVLHRVTRRRLAGIATRYEDGNKAQCEYGICTPWVETTAITTEEF